MSADNYMLIRRHGGRFVVTQEFLSDDPEAIEDTGEAVDRIMRFDSDPDARIRYRPVGGAWCEGVFDDLNQLKDWVRLKEQDASECGMLEYGTVWAIG
jgi:hypothetical protein